MATYSHYTTPSSPLQYRGGYKDVFKFCPVADFATIAAPAATPAAIGDTRKITTAHTWTGTNGVFDWETQQQTVTVNGESFGDVGAQLMKWTGEFNLLGDSPELQEQLEAQLNAKVIAFVKASQCSATEYVQLGDSCIQPTFKVTYTGGTTASGAHVYKVSFEVVDAKYFYSGAITKSTAA